MLAYVRACIRACPPQAQVVAAALQQQLAAARSDAEALGEDMGQLVTEVQEREQEVQVRRGRGVHGG